MKRANKKKCLESETERLRNYRNNENACTEIKTMQWECMVSTQRDAIIRTFSQFKF